MALPCVGDFAPLGLFCFYMALPCVGDFAFLGLFCFYMALPCVGDFAFLGTFLFSELVIHQRRTFYLICSLGQHRQKSR
jgi:hypothetical protein